VGYPGNLTVAKAADFSLLIFNQEETGAIYKLST